MSEKIIEFQIPATIRVRELIDKLKLHFPVREDGIHRLQRCYQDTFDWRLYQKGIRYFVDQYPDYFSINCQARNKSIQLVTNQVPVFSRDFSSAELHRQLDSVMSIRALITWVDIQLVQHHLRLVDGEDKTQVNIYVENSRLDSAERHTRSLGKRIRLVPVRGYEKSVAGLTAYLVNEWQLTGPERSEFEQACQLLDLSPAVAATKATTKLSEDMRTDEALKQLLLVALDEIEKNVEGSIQDIDTEFLHDLRVATRRTRSILSLVQQVFPQRTLERFEKGFAWVGEITGPTRDMDVYLLKFDTYQQSLPQLHQPHLEALRNFLKQHHRQEQQKLAQALKSAKFLRLLQDWRKFLQQPVPARTQLENAMQPVKQVADRHIWKVYKKVMKRGSAITHSCPDEKLHRLRISCKKLRYLLDFFQSLYPSGKFRQMIKILKKLQDVLGDFQDLSVQIERLKSFEAQMQTESLMTPDTHEAIHCLVEQLGGNIKQQRQLFYQAFKGFCSPAMQDQFTSLFHSTGKQQKA